MVFRCDWLWSLCGYGFLEVGVQMSGTLLMRILNNVVEGEWGVRLQVFASLFVV